MYLTQRYLCYAEGISVVLDSSGTLIKNTSENKLIAVLGIKDLVIVNTKDILLVVPREKATRVKDIQKKLAEKHLEKYL